MRAAAELNNITQLLVLFIRLLGAKVVFAKMVCMLISEKYGKKDKRLLCN